MPSISLPLLQGNNGLPIGVQLVSSLFDDERLFRNANWLTSKIKEMKLSEKITIILGIALVAIFVIGLAWSISTGLGWILERTSFLDYRNILSLSYLLSFFKGT